MEKAPIIRMWILERERLLGGRGHRVRTDPPPRPHQALGPEDRSRAGRLGPCGVLALALALGCGDRQAPNHQLFEPALAATTPVPLDAGSVALLADERTACVSEYYEVRVRCVDRDGSIVGVFGRAGEGPGEFGSISLLVGGMDGTVGVVDNRANRFSVFEPAGALVMEVPTPGAMLGPTPTGPFGATVSMVGKLSSAAHGARRQAGSGYFAFRIDLASGEVLSEEESPPANVEIECERVYQGFRNPAGGWVLIACRGHLIFVSADGEATLVQSPAYFDELPSEREVARRTEQLGALARRPRGPAVRVSPEELESYRNTPKAYHMGGGMGRFDATGRLWIATQRDHNEFSYLDVFSAGDAAFVGSVKVRDHMKAFDLVGSTLVVLVERAAGPDGFPDRAIGWYDVGATLGAPSDAPKPVRR